MERDILKKGDIFTMKSIFGGTTSRNSTIVFVGLFGSLMNIYTDMIFVTSSTSSASVKKKLDRVKLSRGNAQSVFFFKV